MTVKWGLIGCGRIANTRVIPEGITMAENARLVCVSDIRPERAQETASKFDVKAYKNNQDLLTDPSIDAVYIATPPSSHAELTIAAARQGKHVLCQKPIGLNAAEGEEMVRVCKEQNVKLGIGYMMRFHGAHQKMKELIHAGVIGQPVGARVRYSVWSPPSPPGDEYGDWMHDREISGGGPMMDLGVHAIDLMIMMLGRIVEVASLCDTLVHGYEVEDTSSCLFKFENGAQGILECYSSIPNFDGRRMIEVYGSEGLLAAENTIFQLPSGNLWHYKKTAGGITNAQPEPLEYVQENMYWNEIRLFTEALENDSQLPIPGEDGHHIQQIVDAVYSSSAERRYIQIN